VSFTELALSLAAGALTTLSPCVLPVIPFVTGAALHSHRLGPIAVALGMTASFTLAGLIIEGALLGSSVDGESLRRFAAIAMLLSGVVLAIPRLQDWLSERLSGLGNWANAQSKKGVVSRGSLAQPFFVGTLLGLIWAPCTGPLLAGALSMVASSEERGRGTVLLAVFGFGSSLPLLLVAYASRGWFNRKRELLLSVASKLKLGMAVLFILLGLSVLLGFDKAVEAFVLDLLPESWINLTTRI
jgi:cytochrome c-type biogenesis protein